MKARNQRTHQPTKQPMTTEQVIATLREHNEWRRGGEGEMLDPKTIGKAIEAACDALEELCDWTPTRQKELEAEVAEQARLLGMSSEREAALQAKIERLQDQLHNLRPQPYGWKSINKMTKRELINEINRLNEVLEITARRHETLRKIVADFQWANRPRQSLTIITGTRTTNKTNQTHEQHDKPACAEAVPAAGDGH